MEKAVLFMRVSDLDPTTKCVTFTLGARTDSYTQAGGFEVVRKTLAALQGECLTRLDTGGRAHSAPEVGDVTHVLADVVSRRITVTARVLDPATWAKLEAGVYKGARVALWGSSVNRSAGQLMLVDAPEFSDVILRRDHGSLDRVSEVLDRAGAVVRSTFAAIKRAEDAPAPPKTAGAGAVFAPTDPTRT